MFWCISSRGTSRWGTVIESGGLAKVWRFEVPTRWSGPTRGLLFHQSSVCLRLVKNFVLRANIGRLATSTEIQMEICQMDNTAERLTATRAEAFTSGVKQAIAVNSGGAVALLAFLQAIWEAEKQLAGFTLAGIGIMAFGVFLGLLVTPIRVRHMHNAHDRHLKDPSPDLDTRGGLWMLYHGLLFMCMASFPIGCGFVVFGAASLL